MSTGTVGNSSAYEAPVESTRSYRAALAGVLLLALAIRAAVVLTQVYVVHPDEVFQYLEQGHRLAFGSGVKPWEYFDGIRSWFLPGIIAGIMKLCAVFSPDPAVYLDTIRLLASLCSLTVVYVGFRLALLRLGMMAALVTGALCAVWFDAVFYAPTVMTEVLATYCALGAAWLAERRDARDTWRTMAFAGALLGLAFSLRFHMAPPLFVIALWQCRLEWRRRWLPLLLGALAIVVPILGVLDFLTWGSPFQSVWLNFVRNVPQGVSTAINADPKVNYLALIAATWTVAGTPLLGLGVLGALRAPLLALAAATTIVSMSLFAHKEYRFICFALLAAPILVGLGAARIFEVIDNRFGNRGRIGVRVAFVLATASVSVFAWNSLFMRVQRQHMSGNLEAFLLASRQPALCGLGVFDIDSAVSGGYSYLHRDVPLYYSRLSYASDVKEKVAQSGLELKLELEFEGAPLPHYDSADLLRRTQLYNFALASANHAPPGFRTLQCFANAPDWLWPLVCLYQRPGGCSGAAE
jgi:GPI mannosyltransferase 3